jgi:hypothetical protein
MTTEEPPLYVDPTENLTEQLAAANELLERLQEKDSDAVVRETSERLARLVLALADWIEHGGSLPDQWRQAGDGVLDEEDADPTIADMDGGMFAGVTDDD